MVTADRLAALGFAAPERAIRDTQALATRLSPEILEALLIRCAAAADPDAALAACERVVARRRPASPAALEVVAGLGGASDFLARRLAARPRLAEWIAASAPLDRPRPRETVRRIVASAVARVAAGDVEGMKRALRRAKYREIARIAWRDLAGRASLAEVGRELSNLAEACVEAAIRFLDASLRELFGAPEGEGDPGRGFCVLAMGKLGGEELNFSSDIDLVYVYGADGTTAGGRAGALTHLQYYARLAEALTGAIAEMTPDGFAFRVDLSLRPDGRNGPIVCSLAALERYYEAHGRTWERVALLRARPLAGDRAVGERALAALEPFVYRRSVSHAMVAEMQAMKREIDRKVRSHAGDVKLGRGGIREVEFFVQALQLVYAGRDARLRERNTLAALEMALFTGRVTPRDRDTLAEAYVFLRRLENRLQMIDDRQTHVLPESPALRRRVARALDLCDEAALARELDRHRRAVQAIFADMLVASGDEAPELAPDLAAALDPATAVTARAEALSALGFADPVEAATSLAGLARRGGSPFRASGSIDPRAARLLSDAAATPDPDRALFHLAEFFGSLTTPAPWFDLLAQNPHTGRLLVGLFGTSDHLSRAFLRHPELLDALVRADAAAVRRTREELVDRLSERVAPHLAFEDRLAAIGRFKNEEVLRIGLNDVAGALELSEVGRQLSDVADAVLAEVLPLAAAEATDRFGVPADDALAVLGLGKLGGRELGYHSDLDLLFVYGTPGETRGGRRGAASHQEYFALVAQRVCSALQTPLREGSLYRIDTRLRPSGSHGTLVVSLEAYAAHQVERAQLWERQALLRARRVAGNAALGERIEREAIGAALRRPIDPAEAAAEIHRLRTRMEREISRETADAYDPKYGPGGLTDIEFVVQYVQLCHVASRPALREASTVPALERLLRAGLVATDDAAILADAYNFLRRLEQRLQIVHDHVEGAMPRHGRTLGALARRLGYEGADAGDRLLADYAAWTARVRAVYARVLGRR